MTEPRDCADMVELEGNAWGGAAQRARMSGAAA